jgi:hypothetical protein
MSWRAAGSSCAISGRASSSICSAAGKPVRDASISGPSAWKNRSRSGESAPRSRSVGLSSRAAGRSCVISGSVVSAKLASRSSVSVDSRSNVGSARNVCLSSSLRAAVAWNTRLAFSISDRSWPSRSLSASNTTPVFETRLLTAPSWRLRMSTIRAVSSANGARLPSASLTSRP